MNCNPDYNSTMLKQYFKEQNFTTNEQQQLLNENPFNKRFVRWEKNQLLTNRIIANTIKRKKLIDSDTTIQEIVNHEDNSIGKYLSNNTEYYTNLGFFIRKDGIILIRDSINFENMIVKKLYKNDYSFITGICTSNLYEYHKKLKIYKEIASYIKQLQIIEATDNNQNICLVKKM